MRPLKAGLIYFLLVFALGWVLGPIRELWAVPSFGRIAALLIEAVIMLIAMFFSSRWVMRRFDVHQTLGSTILTGCGKSRDLEKTDMKQALCWKSDHYKSMGYGRAAPSELQRSHHQPTFSATC